MSYSNTKQLLKQQTLVVLYVKSNAFKAHLLDTCKDESLVLSMEVSKHFSETGKKIFHRFGIPTVLDIAYFSESSNISTLPAVHPVPHLRSYYVRPINEAASNLQDLYILILTPMYVDLLDIVLG